MVISFMHFYAMYYISAVLTRLISMKTPDSFIGRAMVFAQ